MPAPAMTSATILVASESPTDAALVKTILLEEFPNIQVSADPEAAAADFERFLPEVLVLAFNAVDKAEAYYLGLHRQCPALQLQAHRTIILCAKNDVKRVYELCKRNHFDDYVLFWPMTFDMPRLPMAVHHALRDLAAARDDAPSVAEFAAQARRVAELGGALDHELGRGGQHVGATTRAMAQTQQEIDALMEEFSVQLTGNLLPEPLSERNALALGKEIGRLRSDEIAPRLRAAAEQANPLAQWANDLAQARAPQLESLRSLNALAERVRPTVFIVDDDAMQCQLAAQILADENYALIFASDGGEALGLLRRVRPDLVLMDISMPGIDGIETTRRLKTLPRMSALPVIMITGKSEEYAVIESRKAGAIDFVVKPFHPATLLAKVARALRSSP